jgi:hypothetical protein
MRRQAVAMSLALVALTAAPAAEAPAGQQGPMTLDGSCDLTGTVTFRPPLTNELRPVAQRARIAGGCTGTLTDRRGRDHELSNARARYASAFPAQPASCLAGTPKGAGAILLRGGRLGFTAQERRATALGTLVLTGARGGSAVVTASPPPSGNPVPLVQACNGAGIKQVKLTVHVQTAPVLSG